jgi:predicted Zn-dependent protease
MSTTSVTTKCGQKKRTSLRVWTALLACCLMPVGARTQQELPEALRLQFQAALQAEKAGRLEEAARDLLKILHEGGNLASVHNNLGTIYQQQGDHAQAMAEFREAIRLQPQFVAPHVLLGASLLATHHIPDAIQELDHAAGLAPNEPSIHEELAKAYDRAGNPIEVVNQYQILNTLAPHDAEYTYQLGEAYLKLSQWCIQQIRQNGPKSARWYETVAEALLGQGQADRAISFFQRAAQADPKLPGIHLALAQIYLQRNSLAEAGREVNHELDLVPESVAAQALQSQIASREHQSGVP